MAKYEYAFKGQFDHFLDHLHQDITRGSLSATFEDGSDRTFNGMRVAVRVYERYSMIGSNRVSLNITLVGNGTDLFISAITSGGSQAVFFKINTLGEESFLDACEQSVRRYVDGQN